MFYFKDLFKKRISLKTINREKVEQEINEWSEFALNTKPRNPRLIVSLTSFPQRINEIHYCIFSLLKQTLKPDEIILWLAEEQFPNKEDDIPQKVLNLKNFGLTIRWCENLYSYKKLIPALKMFPDDIIITTDDDIFYEKDLLERLYTSYLETPEVISSHRCHRVKTTHTGKVLPYKKWKKKINGESESYLNFPTTGGGVLYPPNSLYKDVLNSELFNELSPNADDIWFWAMAVLNQTKIKIIKNNVRKLTYINPARERNLTGEITLFARNKKGGNDIQLQKVLEHYPIIEKII